MPVSARSRSRRTAACSRPQNRRRGDRSAATIDAIEQEPSPLIGHSHIARSGRDRASIPDTFQQRGLARANARTPNQKEWSAWVLAIRFTIRGKDTACIAAIPTGSVKMASKQWYNFPYACYRVTGCRLLLVR